MILHRWGFTDEGISLQRTWPDDTPLVEIMRFHLEEIHVVDWSGNPLEDVVKLRAIDDPTFWVQIESIPDTFEIAEHPISFYSPDSMTVTYEIAEPPEPLTLLDRYAGEWAHLDEPDPAA